MKPVVTPGLICGILLAIVERRRFASIRAEDEFTHLPRRNITVFIINNTNSSSTLSGHFSNYTDSGMTVATFGGFDWHIYYNADEASGALTGGNDVVITPNGKPENVDHPMYFIRDGIVIIAKNGIVPHGTVI